MIFLPFFSKKNILVYGCGLSGKAAAAALKESGAYVLTWDDKKVEYQQFHPLREDISFLHAIVLSPGVPLHPMLKERARSAGVPIIGDIELFWRRIIQKKARVIAITGTNGKSTTTALFTHVLQKNGFDVHMGGNIGVPILSLPEPAHENSVYVLEISSYQIELTEDFTPDVAILLNIFPDHIDRHGGLLENYIAVKRRILERQKKKDCLGIIGVDDPFTQKIYQELRASHPRLLSFSAQESACDPNIQAVQLGSTAFHLTQEDVDQALFSFQNLSHRMEEVGQKNHILFINDSKATNAHSTERAFKVCLKDKRAIFWIAGGVPKEGGITSLEGYFHLLEEAFFIGEAANSFQAFFNEKTCKRQERCFKDLNEAFFHALKQAESSSKPSVILFSPACASFDHYKNFEERGLAFKKLVQNLLGTYA